MFFFCLNGTQVNNKTGVKFEPLLAAQKGVQGTFMGASFELNNNYIGNPATFEAHLNIDNSG